MVMLQCTGAATLQPRANVSHQQEHQANEAWQALHSTYFGSTWSIGAFSEYRYESSLPSDPHHFSQVPVNSPRYIPLPAIHKSRVSGHVDSSSIRGVAPPFQRTVLPVLRMQSGMMWRMNTPAQFTQSPSQIMSHFIPANWGGLDDGRNPHVVRQISILALGSRELY